ncbi:hypothetical protein ABT390_24335 [Streptomyces aurantiacus]|uniref:hypothetical protein n=1 Tax=Streptomyces aurantiacus TaxID=47760 RepID=UPI00332381F5
MATTWRPGVRATGSGTPPPLPVLPQFPGMRGYTQLRRAIRDLGFRHAAELLREPGRQRAAGGVFGTLPKAETDDGFRVLDGLWFPGRGGLWQRVDVPFVRRARDAWQASADPRALTAAAVTDILETLTRDDPMGPRRVVLWELCCLLKDGAVAGTPTTADDVAALGVHRSEARLLAAAVDAVFPADGAPRRAAEEINDVWPGLRLRRAEHVAELLPAAPDDHALAALLRALRARSAKVRFLAYAARRSQEDGDPRAASGAWLRALRQATDAPELRTGLLRAATALADAPSSTEKAGAWVRTQDRGVGVSWRTPHVPGTHPAAPVTYAVLRFDDDAPQAATEIAKVDVVGPEARLLEAHDPAAPLGRALRYAVLPLRGERVAGVPRVTAPVLIAPDVTELTARPVPGGLRLRWRPHPAATEVRVLRYGKPDVGAAHGPDHVLGGPDGAVDPALDPGSYTYEVSCGYPGPGGGVAWSPGVRVSARAERWPTPVEKLTAERVGEAGDRLLLRWHPPRRGRSTLLPWPEGPVAPGTDVSERFARIAAGLAAGGDAPDLRAEAPRLRWREEPAQHLELPVPPAGRMRMTAVSVLGERAVAGASVVVERPDSVRNLTVRRLSADRALVRFAWPEPTVLVLVSWHDATRGVAHRVARTRHLASGGAVELAVPETACTVSVTPLSRPDAVAVPAPTAHAELPALPPPPPAPPPWWHRWRRWLRPGRPRA